GIARIKIDSDKNRVIEMRIAGNYALDKDNLPDFNYMVYKGVASGNNANNSLPVNFWFKKNNEDFFDPWAVAPVLVNSPPPQNNFISADFFNVNALKKNRDLVAYFFSDTSAYYKKIFSPTARGVPLTRDERNNTNIYLIVVASTNDVSLQPNCLIDARKIIQMFTEISGDRIMALKPGNLHIDSIFGNNYSRANVEAALKRLPVNNKNNNLIIFYYSGHGFHNKKYPQKVFPFFDLRNPTRQKFFRELETKTMNVQDIYDTILTKGARFNLVISDCCNDTVAAPKRMWYEPTKKKGVPVPNFDNLKALFMNYKKQINLLMTAASQDEEAVVTPSFNSYFTYFFLQTLTTYLSPEKGFPTWEQIFEAAKSATYRQVTGLPCKIFNCPKQTPRKLLP
ncbi:MAG: caspase family protein, partial [Chitinophagaceae bacterium]